MQTSKVWMPLTGSPLLTLMNNSLVSLSRCLEFSLFRLDSLLICNRNTFLRLSAGKWEKKHCSRIKFSQHVKKQCSLTLAGRQGQVKGSHCQCLLMGSAEGSDGRVISVMMMVMVSYRLPGVPQEHTYLWPATSLSQGEHICLTLGHPDAYQSRVIYIYTQAEFKCEKHPHEEAPVTTSATL